MLQLHNQQAYTAVTDNVILRKSCHRAQPDNTPFVGTIASTHYNYGNAAVRHTTTYNSLHRHSSHPIKNQATKLHQLIAYFYLPYTKAQTQLIKYKNQFKKNQKKTETLSNITCRQLPNLKLTRLIIRQLHHIQHVQCLPTTV